MEVIDKMAQEFDDWYNAVGVWRDASRKDLWLAWKASRSALCVELPSFENGSIRGYGGDCEEASMVVDSIAEALCNAGVSYK